MYYGGGWAFNRPLANQELIGYFSVSQSGREHAFTFTPHQIIGRNTSVGLATCTIDGATAIVAAEKTLEGSILLFDACSGRQLGRPMYGHGMVINGDFGGSIQCIAIGQLDG